MRLPAPGADAETEGDEVDGVARRSAGSDTRRLVDGAKQGEARRRDLREGAPPSRKEAARGGAEPMANADADASAQSRCGGRAGRLADGAKQGEVRRRVHREDAPTSHTDAADGAPSRVQDARW